MRKITFVLALMLSLLTFNSAQAQDAFIGEIRMTAFDFAPNGWALCNGQILSIAQNQALFSLLGTTYGGNGQTTFALPDLRSRVPVHQGQGNGLSLYQMGQVGGAENNTLTISQLPPHTHTVNAVTTEGNQNTPAGNLPADTKVLDKEYSDATPNTTMKSSMIGVTGGGQPVNNIQPYTTVNFIIATQGIYPSRN